MVRTRSPRGQVVAAAALAFALIAVVAVVAINPGAPGAPTPPVPSPAPSEVPGRTPGDSPSPAPTDDISDGRSLIDLDTATDHDVTVSVVDRSGSVVDVDSGRAGDGMSVRWFDVKVENVDDRSIRVTWVGLPRDEMIALTVSASADGYTLDFVQSAPPANSDAIGFDRVIVIAFDAPVDAADVAVEFSEAVPAG